MSHYTLINTTNEVIQMFVMNEPTVNDAVNNPSVSQVIVIDPISRLSFSNNSRSVVVALEQHRMIYTKLTGLLVASNTYLDSTAAYVSGYLLNLYQLDNGITYIIN